MLYFKWKNWAHLSKTKVQQCSSQSDWDSRMIFWTPEVWAILLLWLGHPQHIQTILWGRLVPLHGPAVLGHPSALAFLIPFGLHFRSRLHFPQ